MIRFFYTDPLAAARMAKHHGFRFWNGKHEIHTLPLVDAEGSYYTLIHPDSLHLLEPKAGDLIAWEYPTGEFKERHSYEVIAEGFNHNHFPANAKRLIQETGAQIIQRNGIPFMWPESEAA